MSVQVFENDTAIWQNYEEKIQSLQPQEQEAVKLFWRSLVLRSQRAFSESNGNLPQYANVRSCNCCPYGYHIDLDFVRYCESLANAKPSEEELQRRSRRRSRKSMEFMLGLDSIFAQWDCSDRQQTLTELPQENELDSPFNSLQRTLSFNSTSYQYQPLRQRSSSVPRFTYGSQASQYPRSESPFGTASSTCSSYRGAESDVPYPMRKPAVSVPETKAFLHDALDEVCSDFERTLERASSRRRKVGHKENAGGGRITKPAHNSYFRMDRNNNYPKVLSYGYQEKSRNGGWSWDSGSCVHRDSCVAGNKSPRASSIYNKPLPFQQKLSPAEQQYESYVKATVAANAKSPVEELISPQSPPPPPPRRHILTAKLTMTSPPTAITTTDCAQTSGWQKTSKQSSLLSPNKETAAAAATSADAQTLFNIRQQMALSLKRMKDLEEQVKAIPDLQSELNQLRVEKQRLQQTVKIKEDELQKAKEATRFSSSHSPVLSSKIASPIQFQPQRVSPISLESMGSRMQSPGSTSKSPVLKRDVSTMCSKQTTRDIAVGSPIPHSKTQRDVGCNAALTKSVNENLFTKIEVEERIKLTIRQHEEQKKLARLKDLISVGTQMYVAKKDTKDIGAQTKAAKTVQKHNVGIMAQPVTRESFTSCSPDVRSVGCSNDRVTDVLCEKCLATKRTVACATDEEAKVETAKTISLKLLDMPVRSNTFSLGENEKLNIKKKTIGTQYIPVLKHTAGCQTAAVLQNTVGIQFSPQLQNTSTQFELYTMARQTDTKDLIRLCTSQTSTEEIAAPAPAKQKQTEPVKPLLHTKACNTELKNYKDLGVNTKPAVTTSSASCNTEKINKRDIGCGDVVKRYISIACADNYCDSCKDAIQNLAKDFSKVLVSPLPAKVAESKIPRPKNLPSPIPIRRQLSRQNTYTVTPSPSPSPEDENKSMAGTLQEKSSSSSQFYHLEAASESQNFITEPVSLSAITTEKLPQPNAEQDKLPSTTTANSNSLEDSQQRKSLYDLSKLGDNELIVKEETRVSISWSRDNSPAPTPTKVANPSSTEEDKLKAQQDEQMAAISKEISQGARKKTLLPTPLKSSHDSKVKPETRKEADDDTPQKPLPSKALLQKIAMKETEPRKKITPPKDMLTALKIINNSLLKKLGSKPISSLSLKNSKQTIQTEWFRASSSEKADPHEVEDYLDCFEELSVPLLEYCVNMVDANGNTAMHYAVSHGNFDVVSILLDSKVCNVNQMNNAGYTCVMLVSLAKLKSAEHRTVVERLFQMADVNIRAKKHCQTALMLAVSHGNLEMVQLLLTAGADINIQDEDGSTALMCAAEHGRTDIVKHLLTHPDCDSLIQDVDGSTAFKIAWQAGHRDIGIFLYVHEQMMRGKVPNKGEHLLKKHSPASTSPRYPTHRRQPSK